MLLIRKIYPFLTGLLLLFSLHLSFAQIIANSKSICGIRVEFVEDNNELTTGNGKFMIDTVTVDSFAIDPAPHDKAYFADQITAVSNYFRQVSQNRLELNGEIYPATNDGAYQLPQAMGYYNPNTTDEKINLGISQLFVDAVQAADKDAGLKINDYDVLVIFHAGVGKDINLGYDETPQDIPSLFITLDFLKKSLGEDFQGVPVKDGMVTQGILLPETENQQDIQVALTGIFASNVGSYLGLYDLFSPSRQRSGIGRFGLMDFGLMNLNGLVPSAPSAFSREQLGWEQPVDLDRAQLDIPIYKYDTSQPASEPTTYRVPINDDEYFLIEYRGDAGVNIDSEYVELAEDRDEAPTYLELLKTYHRHQIEMSPNGVLLSVKDYDLGIGGSGVLIWHIDRSVIEAGAGENALNDDPDHRAVDLEEADGSQDIGHIYGLLDAGFQKDLGWFADFWYSNRPKDLADFELFENRFSYDTRPNSRANLNGSNSHITLQNFSANNRDFMTFDFSRGKLQDGYPVKLFTDDANLATFSSGPVQNKTSDFLFVCDDMGNIYAVSDSGSGLLYSGKKLFARLSGTSGSASISLALADTSADGAYDILYAATTDRLFAYHLNRAGVDSLASALFSPVNLPVHRTTPLVTNNGAGYVGGVDDRLYRIDTNGNVENVSTLANGVTDLVLNPAGAVANLPAGSKYAALSRESDNREKIYSWNGINAVFEIGAEIDGNFQWQEFNGRQQPQGAFAVADLDGNGTYDLLYCGSGEIFAYHADGALLNGFPIKPVLTTGDVLVGTPLVDDADGDGTPDIITITREGQILIHSLRTTSALPISMSTGGRIAQSPVIGNYDNDPARELAAVTENGTLYLWQLDRSPEDGPPSWPQAYLNASNNKYLETSLEYIPVSGGLMPAAKVFNYPNPNKEDYTIIRYYLNEDARVSIKIYDAAGTLVEESTGPGTGKSDNEWRWDVSHMASGVYLCRVEAASPGSKESKIIKILVVH